MKGKKWLIVLGFNATLTARVISWRSVRHMCLLAFLHQYSTYFSHMLIAEMRGEYTPERNFASTGSRTHNHQVMNHTRSPLSYSGGAGNHTLRVNMGMQIIFHSLAYKFTYFIQSEHSV